MLKRPWCRERLKAGGEGDDREWDDWMASPTRWTWIWVNSGNCWWTGRPGVLWFMGLQRVGHDLETELNGKKTPNNPIKKWAEDLNIFPKNTYRWSRDTWKYIQNHYQVNSNQSHNKTSPHICYKISDISIFQYFNNLLCVTVTIIHWVFSETFSSLSCNLYFTINFFMGNYLNTFK